MSPPTPQWISPNNTSLQLFSFRLRIVISLSLPCALPDCPLTHFCCIVLAGMYGGAAAEEAAVWGREPPFSPSLARFMPAWGVALGTVFQSFSGRWARSCWAVFVSLYRGCCVYAPGLLSHFGSAFVSVSLFMWSMLVA